MEDLYLDSTECPYCIPKEQLEAKDSGDWWEEFKFGTICNGRSLAISRQGIDPWKWIFIEETPASGINIVRLILPFQFVDRNCICLSRKSSISLLKTASHPNPELSKNSKGFHSSVQGVICSPKC